MRKLRRPDSSRLRWAYNYRWTWNINSIEIFTHSYQVEFICPNDHYLCACIESTWKQSMQVVKIHRASTLTKHEKKCIIHIHKKNVSSTKNLSNGLYARIQRNFGLHFRLPHRRQVPTSAIKYSQAIFLSSFFLRFFFSFSTGWAKEIVL